MMVYMVPLAHLMKVAGLSSADGQIRVTMTYEEFAKLIKLLLRAVEVDEKWYRDKYDDVDMAIKAGEFKSAKHHFVEDGYFEGRVPKPHSIDEKWYIANYDDVARGLRNGDFVSAIRHYVEFGYGEGRLPCEY